MRKPLKRSHFQLSALTELGYFSMLVKRVIIKSTVVCYLLRNRFYQYPTGTLVGCRSITGYCNKIKLCKRSNMIECASTGK